MTRRVSSYRLSEHTLAQIEALSARMGSAANVIAFAVDRRHSPRGELLTQLPHYTRGIA